MGDLFALEAVQARLNSQINEARSNIIDAHAPISDNTPISAR